MQKEIPLKSIETTAEQGRHNKKKMWQNKQNIKNEMFYIKLRNSERSLSESTFCTLVNPLRQEG